MPSAEINSRLPTALVSHPSKSARHHNVPELIKFITHDFEFAEEGRREREDLYEVYWKTFLTEKRRSKIKGRSNSVGPHGGLTIRGLVPLIKRAILSTRPFVRAQHNKRELRPMFPLLEMAVDYWVDLARVRSIVLTHMLKEDLIMGCAWGKVQHQTRDRPVVVPVLNEDTGGADMVETREIIYDGPAVIPVFTEDAYPYPVARDMTELEQSGYFIHRFFKTKRELLEDVTYDQDAVSKIGTRVGPGVNSSIPLDRMFEDRRRRVLGLNITQFEAQTENLRARGDEPVEVLEMIAGGQVYSLANRSIIIREDNLDHPFPIFQLCHDPIPGEIFGKSVFHDAMSPMDQRDFLVNNMYDNVARLVHSTWKGIPGLYDKRTLHPAPGGVTHVRDMNALEPMVHPDIIGSAFNLLAHLDRDLARATGFNEILSAVGSGAGTVYPETKGGAEIKQDNSLQFVGEMISNLEEEGIKRMVSIIFDIEKEYLTPEFWVALAGEEGARWRDVDPDTLARGLDWRIIGSSYAANKESQAVSVTQSFDRMLAIHARDPGVIDLRELASTFLEVWGTPNRERIVRGQPVDVGPEAEHATMAQGLPVEPEPGENFEKHLQMHMLELQRVMAEGGEDDPGYVERLMEHVDKTRDMIGRVQQAQQLMAAEAMQGDSSVLDAVGGGQGQAAVPGQVRTAEAESGV
jgi:hypothetical protein